MILLTILALPHCISATLGGNDWFQHPSRVASENNGTNTKIHCQRFREAEQVTFERHHKFAQQNRFTR